MMFLKCSCGELISVNLADDAEDGDIIPVFVGDHMSHLDDGDSFEVLESQGGEHSVMAPEPGAGHGLRRGRCGGARRGSGNRGGRARGCGRTRGGLVGIAGVGMARRLLEVGRLTHGSDHFLGWWPTRGGFAPGSRGLNR